MKTLRYFASEDPEENQRNLELNNKVRCCLQLASPFINLGWQDLRRELGLLRRLEHPNTVSLLGMTQGFGPILAAVLPWMSNGTLHSFLKNKGQALTVVERLELVSSAIPYLDWRR